MNKVSTSTRASKKSVKKEVSDLDRLVALLKRSPREYESQLAKWKKEDPHRHRAAVEAIRWKFMNDGEPPTTPHEADELLREMIERTGWSRARVIAEAMFLFDTALDQSGVAHVEDYKAQTNAEKRWRWLPTWAQADDELRWQVSKEKAAVARARKSAHGKRAS